LYNVALTIAGSDSSSGAGIQADIKTFSSLEVYGCTVITAITAQNTCGISSVEKVSPKMVKDQIQAILNDSKVDAIKIGMVYDKDIIVVVHDELKKCNTPIVLDPVFEAGAGGKLIRNEAFENFERLLIPLSELITPNIKEAVSLCNNKIQNENDMVDALYKIKKMGAKNVIIKGGHFPNSDKKSVTDFLLTDKNNKAIKFSHPRINISEIHGAGCNFSSAVTAYLARGYRIEEACDISNKFIYESIKNTIKIGNGLLVVNPIFQLTKNAKRYNVIEELQFAVNCLEKEPKVFRLIPETQMNFVYAIDNARNLSDVAGVVGRLVRVEDSVRASSSVKCGASKHVGSALLRYLEKNPKYRSAINIKCDKKLIKICKSLFKVSNYDRKNEPKNIKKQEGMSINWGIDYALKKNPVSDCIYHDGDIGKEPMIILFGKNPSDILLKLKKIVAVY